MEKICKQCGCCFVSKHKSAKFCSHKCANVHSGPSRTVNVRITCHCCGQQFNVKRGDLNYRREIKYCSIKCSSIGIHKNKRVIVGCNNCGSEFSKLKTRLRPKNFCNADCRKSFFKINPPRKGNGYWYENGYRVLYTNDGKGIKEHIQIMENHIGRKMSKEEQVHHINGVKDDNRIENLQLVTRSEHMKIHRLQDMSNGKKLFGG